jgi:hypothetical protein
MASSEDIWSVVVRGTKQTVAAAGVIAIPTYSHAS